MNYAYNGYSQTLDEEIVALIRASGGIRDISRHLAISPTTVLKRILSVSERFIKPPIVFGREYEVDELMTYIGQKEKRICIVYAIDRSTRKVVSFSVGKRNKKTLSSVVNTLLQSQPTRIRTDKYPTYLGLIPRALHFVKNRGINYIERKNLTLRTHLKRLNRRTICFSRSIATLIAVLTIYFWHP